MLVWIEFRHGSSHLRGFVAEVLLINRAVFGDHERHDSRISVFCEISEDGEAAGHFSVDDIVLGTAGRVTLGWDPVRIAIELWLTVRPGGIQILGEIAEPAEGTWRLTVGDGPVQAIRPIPNDNHVPF